MTTTTNNEKILQENKRFLQTLQEQIYNRNYEKDDENINLPKLSKEIEEEVKIKEENIYKEKIYVEKKVDENLDEEEEKKNDEKLDEEEEKKNDEKLDEEEEDKKDEEKLDEEKLDEEKLDEEKLDEEKLSEEKKEKEIIDEEKLNEEKIEEEKKNCDYSPELSPNNINNKELNQYPIELNKIKEIQLEENEKKYYEEDNNLLESQNNHQKLSSIKLAKCKKHGKSFLKINPTNFEIVCEKCIEEGNTSQLKIINNFKKTINISDENDEEKSKFNCFEHKNEKGSFYCEDCKQFVCNMCFADVHREHKCHLPKIITNEFINTLNEEIDNSNKLRPILDDSINDIKKIYDNLKNRKVDTMKIPQNTLKIISVNNDNQIELLKKKVNETFIGIDNDVNDDILTYNGIKEKNKKFLEILKIISAKIDSKKNNFDLCGYHKRKTEILKEIDNFIKTSFNFINVRLTNTNLKYVQNKEKIENSLNIMNKEISNYEKSCISSISTGRENRDIVLLRYVRFVHREIKYFKYSLVGFASDDNIFLTGLVLCGLYIKRNKNKNSINNGDSNNNENNSTTNENNNEDLNISQKIKIPIQITILTMVNQAEGEKLFSQNFELFGVKKEEPYVTINFEKGVKIKKEKLYLIKIENLSDNNYIDLWTGCIGKDNKKKLQVIRCHNTGIQFVFKQTEGIQTDFDEFEQGIIDGVLYSTNK